MSLVIGGIYTMSEEPSSQSHYLLPTYQAPLINAIQQVVIRFNSEGSVMGAWESLETLYSILPPDVHKSISSEYDRIKQRISYALKQRRNPDSLIQQMNSEDAMTRILRVENHPFLTKNRGYLVCAWLLGKA